MSAEIPVVRVRDRKHSDATFLQLDEASKDKNRHYRWVRVDHTNSSVVKHKLKGYEPELKGGSVRTLAETDDRGEGDSDESPIIIGDLMLMSCPVEDFERRVLERKKRTDDLLESTTAETERRAKEKGIKLIQDPDHKKETR